MPNFENDWYELVIHDPDFLSGISIKKFVAPIVELLGIRYVVVRDLAGGALGLSSFDGEMLTVEQFMQNVGIASQYDWAFFFFYQERPSLKECASDILGISSAKLTIRLTDSASFYVYGKNQEAFDYLHNTYPLTESVFTNLANVNVPY